MLVFRVASAKREGEQSRRPQASRLHRQPTPVQRLVNLLLREATSSIRMARRKMWPEGVAERRGRKAWLKDVAGRRG